MSSIKELENLIKVPILKIFKDLFPENQIYDEFDPYNLNFVKKTNCVFHKYLEFSGLPTMYFIKNFFVCYECGNRGSALNLFLHKNEGKTQGHFEKYLQKFNNLKLSEEEKELYKDPIFLGEIAQVIAEYNIEEGTVCFEHSYILDKERYQKYRKEIWRRFFEENKTKIRQLKISFGKRKKGIDKKGIDDLPF